MDYYYAELQQILSNVSQNKLIGTLYASVGSRNEAKEYLEQCIVKLNKEIEKIKSIEEFRFNNLKNIKWMLISVFSDFAKIYQIENNFNKVNEICNNLLQIIGDDYNHSVTMKELLAIMFERIAQLDLAEKFYDLAGYSSRWHAFRIASNLGHEQFAFQMLEKYVMNEVSHGYYDYDEKERPSVNKSMVTVALLEEEQGFLESIKENTPRSIRISLVYGRLLEVEERMLDGLGVYREFIRRLSDLKEQEYIVAESKEINLDMTWVDYSPENLWAPGKYSIPMFNDLLSFVEERIKHISNT